MLGRLMKHAGVLTNKNKCIVKWSSGKLTSNNIGDVLNEFLFEKVFNKQAVGYQEVLNIGIPPVYSFIGSVLDNSAVKNLTVMGSGFKREASKMAVKPKKVISCRGPLTRGKLIKMGLEVPEVYGDPAILLPQFYNPTVEKKYRMGLIPHYVDKDLEIVKKWSGYNDVKNIDVFSSMETFVTDLKSCDFTVSSSLHGVILSHAYGIPSAWAPLSDKLAGGGFKFDDYYQSVNSECERINLKDYNSSTEVEIHTSLPHLTEVSENLLKTLKAVKF